MSEGNAGGAAEGGDIAPAAAGSAVSAPPDDSPAESPSGARAGAVRGRGGAVLVAAGIFLSRIFGLVRQRVMSHYLGTSDAADAFNAALRIPNFLQNLFGEGILSASFIPVYARLLAEGDEREATHVAGAVAAILAAITSVLVLLGVLATPWIIDVIALGFEGEKRDLTVRLVRILFPGAGLLVMSAWCLGVLNSHRHFFLSYAAPIVWNVAIIAALLGFGGRLGQADLAVVAAWVAVVGSGLQLLVQLPTVLRVLPHFRPALDATSAHVRAVFGSFLPVFVGRGVVQVSAFVDVMLASLLPGGAVAALTSAQTIYMLPVSLFGMSVSAAELPAMSGAVGDESTRALALRTRLDAGLRRIAFFVVPSAMAFLALGDVVAGALFQTGQFRRSDTVWVWGILAGSAVGLLASTLGRLYSSTYYALRDTRTPVRFAVARVVLTIALGYLFAIELPPLLGVDSRWGAAGLTASAGIAGWVELWLLRRGLRGRVGRTGIAPSHLAALWGSAAAAAAVAWGVKLAVGTVHPVLGAAAILAPYGVVYFGLTSALRVPESRAVVGKVLRRRR
jgi:putative peptidoglycan lipid II flippase